jgi:hypothetical protein
VESKVNNILKTLDKKGIFFFDNIMVVSTLDNKGNNFRTNVRHPNNLQIKVLKSMLY